jgi:hypothetical protein
MNFCIFNVSILKLNLEEIFIEKNFLDISRPLPNSEKGNPVIQPIKEKVYERIRAGMSSNRFFQK